MSAGTEPLPAAGARPAELLRQLGGFDARTWQITLGSLLLALLWLHLGSVSRFASAFPGLAAAPLGEWYGQLYRHVGALVAFALLPLLFLRCVHGVRPAALGVALGDWRSGAALAALACLVATPFVYASSLDPAFQAAYPLISLAGFGPAAWVLWELTYLLYYVGWELLFRGVLIFGLRDRMGLPGAIVFSTSVSTLLHYDKPFGDALASILFGVALPLLALRTGSILWPLLFHWYVGALMDLLSHHQSVAGG
jgi:membrane protease YdiL (CAAX protease family)